MTTQQELSPTVRSSTPTPVTLGATPYNFLAAPQSTDIKLNTSEWNDRDTERERERERERESNCPKDFLF